MAALPIWRVESKQMKSKSPFHTNELVFKHFYSNQFQLVSFHMESSKIETRMVNGAGDDLACGLVSCGRRFCWLLPCTVGRNGTDQTKPGYTCGDSGSAYCVIGYDRNLKRFRTTNMSEISQSFHFLFHCSVFLPFLRRLDYALQKIGEKWWRLRSRCCLAHCRRTCKIEWTECWGWHSFTQSKILIISCLEQIVNVLCFS